MSESQELVQSPARERAAIERGLAMDATSFEGINSVFNNGTAFQLAVRMAQMLAESTIMPDTYQGNPSNCLIAIDYAARLKVSPVMLAQNMDVVKGRPGLRGTFLAGIINASPLFGRIKYEWRGQSTGHGSKKDPSPDYGCRAYATETETGEVLVGTWIDWAMVLAEGWNKNSKWTSLREQMFMYRAAAFWSRAFASDVTLGLHESDELHDADPAPRSRMVTHEVTSATDDFTARMEKRNAYLARARADAEYTNAPDDLPASHEVDDTPTTTEAAPEPAVAPVRRRRAPIE